MDTAMWSNTVNSAGPQSGYKPRIEIWRVCVAFVGLSLLICSILYLPYRLRSGFPRDGIMPYDCTVSVLRLVRLPPTQRYNLVYDAATFWKRVLLIILATGLAVFPSPRTTIRDPLPRVNFFGILFLTGLVAVTLFYAAGASSHHFAYVTVCPTDEVAD